MVDMTAYNKICGCSWHAGTGGEIRGRNGIGSVALFHCSSDMLQRRGRYSSCRSLDRYTSYRVGVPSNLLLFCKKCTAYRVGHCLQASFLNTQDLSAQPRSLAVIGSADGFWGAAYRVGRLICLLAASFDPHMFSLSLSRPQAGIAKLHLIRPLSPRYCIGICCSTPLA